MKSVVKSSRKPRNPTCTLTRKCCSRILMLATCGNRSQSKFYMQDTLDLFQKVLEATTPVGVKAANIQMTFFWRFDIERARGLCWLEAAEKSTTFATYVVGKSNSETNRKHWMKLVQLSHCSDPYKSTRMHQNKQTFEINASFYTTMSWGQKIKQRLCDWTYRHIHAAENNSLRTDLLKTLLKAQR